VGPQIARQGQRLSESLPKLLETVSSGQIAEQIGKEQVGAYQPGCSYRTYWPTTVLSFSDWPSVSGLRVADVAQQAWLLIRRPYPGGVLSENGRAFGEVLLSVVHSRPQREFLEGVLAI